MSADEIQKIVDQYLAVFPDERAKLKLLLKQLAAGDVMNNRKTLPGHITGGAIVLSRDRSQILLIHHKLFDKWLQPGGHWDPDDATPWDAAQREASEETGVVIAEQLPVFSGDVRIPLDIDSHDIPARPEKNEQPHVHHDFRYVFVAANEKLQRQASEVHAAAWFAFNAPETKEITQLIAKLQACGLI